MPTKQFYYKNNRFQQLKGFYYTVQKGGVAKAAKHMQLTQSAVSTQIKSLERDLGVKLFDRKKRALLLTDDGQLLYKYAIEAVHSMDNIYERFLIERTNSGKTIDISTNHISMLYLLPDVITKFKDLYPDIHIMLRNISRQEGMRRLLDNETDLCLYPYTDIPDECDFISIADYDPVLLLRKDHPLTQISNPTLDDVAQYDLIRVDPHLTNLPLFEEIVHSHKLGSNIKFENGDWEMLKKLVKAKAGIAIISSLCLEKNDVSLVGIPMTQYFPQLTYGVCIKKTIEPAESVTHFVNILSRNGV